MAPYAANFTNRYRLRYSTLSREHTITIRYGTDPGDAVSPPLTGLLAFLNEIAPFRFTDWTVVSASIAAAGSDFFLPATTPSVDAGEATISDEIGQVPSFLAPRAISAGATQYGFTVFGVVYDPASGVVGSASDYRVHDTENATIMDAIDALVADTGLTAIDGNPLIWYRYVNIGFNSHYQRKVRR